MLLLRIKHASDDNWSCFVLERMRSERFSHLENGVLSSSPLNSLSRLLIAEVLNLEIQDPHFVVDERFPLIHFHVMFVCAVMIRTMLIPTCTSVLSFFPAFSIYFICKISKCFNQCIYENVLKDKDEIKHFLFQKHLLKPYFTLFISFVIF